LVEGDGPAAMALERTIVDLARKSVEAPKRLVPRDLEPLRAAAGDGAITYALVAGSFHFINRIADLLHVDPEALPAGLRRFELLRRLGVRVAARLFRGVDLANRPYGRTYEQAIAESGREIEALLGRSLGDRLDVLRTRPHGVDILRLALEERDQRGSLPRALIARVQQGVEDALPSRKEEAVGFHPRPRDPVDAFVFVGTRYAARTTLQMIDALRSQGFNDVGVLDLAIAVADANQWARTHRLLGLDPGLFYLDAVRPARVDAIET
jgi:hypothetical protein